MCKLESKMAQHKSRDAKIERVNAFALHDLSFDVWNPRQLERALIEDWPVHRLEPIVWIILAIPLSHV
jgi:hypothetical protein